MLGKIKSESYTKFDVGKNFLSRKIGTKNSVLVKIFLVRKLI